MGTVYNPHFTMKAVLLFSVLASAFAAPDTRFLCSECVDEMHNLGFLVRAGAHDIRDYLAANYCPTVEAGQILHWDAGCHCPSLLYGRSSPRLSDYGCL